MLYFRFFWKVTVISTVIFDLIDKLSIYSWSAGQELKNDQTNEMYIVHALLFLLLLVFA